MTTPLFEILRPFTPRPITHALFDFDGTLSCIRDGWTGIMWQQFWDEIHAHHNDPDVDMLSRGEKEKLVETIFSDIESLTGRQTIIQMQRLAERVKQFGGTPKDPEEYKAEFLRRLEKKMEAVIFGIQSGELDIYDYRILGAYNFLFNIAPKIQCSLFSGTDQKYVERDAGLLMIDSFFVDRMYGATPDLNESSKERTIRRIIAENGISADNLVVFGDGIVEMEEARAVGALAVGIASRESANGERDEAKRNRLADAGADLIVTDYSQWQMWWPLVAK